MFRLKDLIRRIEHLEYLLDEEFYPKKCDACCSCINGVLCVTSRGNAHYICKKDVMAKCPDFSPLVQMKQPE